MECNMNLSLDAQIEALMFFRNEPLSLARLSEYTGKSEAEVREAVEILKTKMMGRGVEVLEHADTFSLATNKEMSPVIEKITKDELLRDIGRAGLETLSLILYKGPISRREIDYIRGVNSSFVIRNLSIRGLIERTENKDGERSHAYTPSFELLQFLGINSINELPEFENFQKQINEFQSETEQQTEPPASA